LSLHGFVSALGQSDFTLLTLLGDIMKLPFIIIALLGGLMSLSTAGAESENLKAATAVMVANQMVTNPTTLPITITDSNTVASLASAIQTAPGKWKKGSFTAPAGYVRFAFLRDSRC
jgi:hypothetical protein